MNIDKLPWIELDDKDAAYQVVEYLPEAPVILEAGACDAEDTLRFKGIWPDAIIHCFEPNTDLFDIASRNIQNAGFNGITLYPVGLADTSGDRTFYMSAAMPAASSLFDDSTRKDVQIPQSVVDSLKLAKPEDYLPDMKDVPTTLPFTTIDEWRESHEIGNIDYIWLDVEGAELIALKGGIETMKKAKVISLEYSFQEFRNGWVLIEELLEFMNSNGFVMKSIWKAHDNWCGNTIFVRKDLA